MASVRLNETIRLSIMAALMKHRFGEATVATIRTKLEQEWERKWRDRIYNLVFDANTRRRINRVPKGWLPKAQRMRFYLTLHNDEGETFHRPIHLYMKKEKPVPANYNYGGSDEDQAIFGPNEPITRDYVKAQATITEAKDLWNQAWGTLNSVTTTKRLLEEWPEVEPFIPKHAKQPGKTLAPNRAALNESFGLPI